MCVSEIRFRNCFISDLPPESTLENPTEQCGPCLFERFFEPQIFWTLRGSIRANSMSCWLAHPAWKSRFRVAWGARSRKCQNSGGRPPMTLSLGETRSSTICCRESRLQRKVRSRAERVRASSGRRGSVSDWCVRSAVCGGRRASLVRFRPCFRPD